MCPAMIGGGKRNPKAGILVPGTIETLCANTSVSIEPTQSSGEKKGSPSPFYGDRSTDPVDAMKSTLNRPISSQTA